MGPEAGIPIAVIAPPEEPQEIATTPPIADIPRLTATQDAATTAAAIADIPSLVIGLQLDPRPEPQPETGIAVPVIGPEATATIPVPVPTQESSPSARAAIANSPAPAQPALSPPANHPHLSHTRPFRGPVTTAVNSIHQRQNPESALTTALVPPPAETPVAVSNIDASTAPLVNDNVASAPHQPLQCRPRLQPIAAQLGDRRGASAVARTHLTSGFRSAPGNPLLPWQ